MVVDRNTQHGKILTNRPTGSGHIDDLICIIRSAGWKKHMDMGMHRPGRGREIRYAAPGTRTIHALYVPMPAYAENHRHHLALHQQVDFSSDPER
jgi:hypothetical protein